MVKMASKGFLFADATSDRNYAFVEFGRTEGLEMYDLLLVMAGANRKSKNTYCYDLLAPLIRAHAAALLNHLGRKASPDMTAEQLVAELREWIPKNTQNDAKKLWGWLKKQEIPDLNLPNGWTETRPVCLAHGLHTCNECSPAPAKKPPVKRKTAKKEKPAPEPKPKPAPEPGYNDIDVSKDLEKKLREWRKEESIKRKIPPYLVISEGALRKLANRTMCSREDIINATSSRCFELFGDDLMVILGIKRDWWDHTWKPAGDDFYECSNCNERAAKTGDSFRPPYSFCFPESYPVNCPDCCQQLNSMDEVFYHPKKCAGILEPIREKVKAIYHFAPVDGQKTICKKQVRTQWIHSPGSEVTCPKCRQALGKPPLDAPAAPEASATEPAAPAPKTSPDTAQGQPPRFASILEAELWFAGKQAHYKSDWMRIYKVAEVREDGIAMLMLGLEAERQTGDPVVPMSDVSEYRADPTLIRCGQWSGKSLCWKQGIHGKNHAYKPKKILDCKHEYWPGRQPACRKCGVRKPVDSKSS